MFCQCNFFLHFHVAQTVKVLLRLFLVVERERAKQFVFRHLPTARPTPFDRQRAAAERRAQANMPNFGPKTQLETVEEELSEARKRIAHLEEANASLRGNLDVLKSQVFRYENIKEDRRQLLFLTGLTPEMWFALWSFIKPSRENIISAKSAASEARGRVNTAGAGRKSVLSLEDELLMTLMRLRLARQEQDLAYQFGVSCSSVSGITLMWKFVILTSWTHSYLAQMGRY